MIASRHPTIAIDAMSGDFGPEVTIPAALKALENHANLIVILVGDQPRIEQYLATLLKQPEPRCFVQHATQTINASSVAPFHQKTDASIYMALNLIKQKKANACVSAANTGVVTEMAHSVLEPLPGIEHATLSLTIPTLRTHHSLRVLDLGANFDPEAKHLLQSAIMGRALSQTIDQIASPTLGLLNISREANQGNRLLQKADALLSQKAKLLNYMGCIEAKRLFNGGVDIVICDGFTGNIALKLIEGGIQSAHTYLTQSSSQSGFSRLTSGMIKPFFKQIEKQVNLNAYNGASLVGLKGIILISHEKADQEAFYYAIQKAIDEVQHTVPQRITSMVESFK